MPQTEYDKVRAVLQTVLEDTSQALGARSGFVQRTSKVTAVRFVQMLVLGCLARADASLGDMVEVGADLGVAVSATGLNQRIDDEAVALLQGVLQALLAQSQAVAVADASVLAQFAAVYIEDTTYLSLPAHMAAGWRGSGGSASAAGMKVRLVYEYQGGTLHTLELRPGCAPDQACPLPCATTTPGALYLFDLGFFGLQRLQAIADRKDYFVCRHQHQTALYDSDGGRLELMKLLKGVRQQAEFAVWLGANHHLPVRLLCQRLPAEQVRRRRKRVQAEARRMRRTLSPAKQQLLPWNLFLTNLPAPTWSLEQTLTLYRLRWQIELLFKLLKSQLGLDHCGPWRSQRILCQLYARLSALVIVHWLLAPIRFPAACELSLPKALTILQRMTPQFAQVIAQGWSHFHAFWQRLIARCLHHALKDQRRHQPSTYSRLLAMNP